MENKEFQDTQENNENATDTVEGSLASEKEESVEEKVQQLENKLGEMKDNLLRALADAENTRKRAHKEKEESVRFGITSFARDLLHIADNLSRALKAVDSKTFEDKEVQGFVDGVKMTEKELLKTFERHHIVRIAPKAGDPFDHHQHQAMFEVENNTHPAGSIVEVMQDGFILHDRLLRPALVGIAKGGEASPSTNIEV